MHDMTEKELRKIAYARAAECRANMFKSEKKVWDLPKEELLSAGYYWGISEIIGEIEMILIKSELTDNNIDNLHIVKEIRNYIKSIV